MRTFSLALITALSFGSQVQANQEADDHMFADSLNGLLKYSVSLPEKSNEDDLKIELIAFKTGDFDCNQRFISGEFERKSLEGWGYSYFELNNTDKPMPSTLMACPPSAPPILKASIVPGVLQNYNSKIPLVAYLPEGYQFSYRVWDAGEVQQVQR